MMEPDAIVKKLEVALPGAQVAVHDLTGTQDHYKVTIVASQFDGLIMLKQHRMVYAIMSDCMEDNGGGIHALSLNTYTPQQWAETKGT